MEFIQLYYFSVRFAENMDSKYFRYHKNYGVKNWVITFLLLLMIHKAFQDLGPVHLEAVINPHCTITPSQSAAFLVDLSRAKSAG